ncbi:SAM-dependent methyltransferase [Kaistia sp. 32K]|nr:SAM-dependent methyltransferase [Kaistia sp. 32K]
MYFLGQWLAAPLRTAAIAPSGRALARLMSSEVGPQTGPVIELGPGTGVFTRALLDRGVAEQDLVLVELNPSFAQFLRRRFARACVLEMNAAELARTSCLDGITAGAVLSGLGLLSMPRQQVVDILDGAFRHLRPHCGFYQFTYGMRCPVPDTIQNRLGLRARRLGGTFLNLPPAAVYRISRDVGSNPTAALQFTKTTEI